MKEELKKLFLSIMEYQMDNFELARTTKPYKLAEEGIKLLEQNEDAQLKRVVDIEKLPPSELIALQNHYDEKWNGGCHSGGCKTPEQVEAREISNKISKRLIEITNNL